MLEVKADLSRSTSYPPYQSPESALTVQQTAALISLYFINSDKEIGTYK